MPELFTYALSFFVVGMYWMAHHRTFRLLVRVNRTLLWINLAVLGFVALLPFPTEILGKYGDDHDRDRDLRRRRSPRSAASRCCSGGT